MLWNVHFWLFFGGFRVDVWISVHMNYPFLLVVSSFLLPKTGCMKLTEFAPICGDWTLVSSNFGWKPILFLAVSKCEMAGLPTLPWWLLPGYQVWHCCDWGMWNQGNPGWTVDDSDDLTNGLCKSTLNQHIHHFRLTAILFFSVTI